jgi:hypothetical protein
VYHTDEEIKPANLPPMTQVNLVIIPTKMEMSNLPLTTGIEFPM